MLGNGEGAFGWQRPRAAELGAVCLVLAVALALRLYGIVSFPFWEDELYSIDEANELFWSRYDEGIFARPLYLLLMNVLSPVLPETAWGLRLPALAFGMASIGLAWVVARHLAGPWAGVISAVTVSLAPGHLYISTINRYWSLVFLLGLAFGWLAIRTLQRDSAPAYRRALALLLVGAATHPLFLTAAAAIGLGSCVDLAPPRPRWRWPTRGALSSLWLPALAVLLMAYGVIAWSQGARHVAQVGHASSIQLAQRLRIVPAIAFGLTPVVAVGCLLGAWRLRQSGNPEALRWAATLLVGAPLSVAILLILSGVTSVTAIYGSALTPLCFVAFGGLSAQAPEQPWPRAFAPVLFALTVAAMLPSTVSQVMDGGRFDFRPAFEAIRRADPSLPVVMTPVVQAAHYAPELRRLELGEDGSVDRLEALREANTRFWLVLTERRHGISFDPAGLRLAFASRRCTAWGEFGRSRLDYEMYRVRLYLCDR